MNETKRLFVTVTVDHV